jgi:hypothetical protein
MGAFDLKTSSIAESEKLYRSIERWANKEATGAVEVKHSRDGLILRVILHPSDEAQFENWLSRRKFPAQRWPR